MYFFRFVSLPFELDWLQKTHPRSIRCQTTNRDSLVSCVFHSSGLHVFALVLIAGDIVIFPLSSGSDVTTLAMLLRPSVEERFN